MTSSSSQIYYNHFNLLKYYLMKDIILFGMPGAGKWTQADLLKEYVKDQYIHLSTGDVFRALMSRKNAIGDLVQERMNNGELISDKVTISLFDVYFFSVMEADKHMILDGYPRSIPQLNSFLTSAHDYNRELIGIYFEIPPEIAIQRMMDRAREWEDEAIMRTRLEKYYKYTHPIMQAYAAQQQLITIDASGTIEQIHEQVIEALKEYN